MTPADRRNLFRRIRERLASLYGGDGRPLLRRLKLLLGMYEELPDGEGAAAQWDQTSSLLITYGDMVQRKDERPLETLNGFLRTHLDGVIKTVHILPFFPYSSDDGFSVIDYRKVDPRLGRWSDVRALGRSFELMFDLVLNHCSRHSAWFRNFVKGVAPERHFFHVMEPFTDLSEVVRPRQSPLLTKIGTRNGDAWVWTTFSDDQVDLDFSNPDVLLEFVDILLLYAAMGARIVRLDAVAFLWKRVGTNCLHLPETHEVVKLLRDVLEIAAPQVLVLTETNVPHAENVSYFGAGDEAHMVYNFSLPPLLLHALQTGSGRHLTRWASELSPPPAGCTYLNFTASHDGVGVRPLEGLVATDEIRKLGDTVRRLGGHVSEKSNADGTTSPYELNITYFDAMKRPGELDATMQERRFLCSQTIALALRGVPAVYFHSLTATPNDVDGVRRLGYPRAVNRHKWDADMLEASLGASSTPTSRVFRRYCQLLRRRACQPAFHPDAPQRVIALSDAVFALERTAPDAGHALLCISNLTDEAIELTVERRHSWIAAERCHDLLDNERDVQPSRGLRLEPYQTMWLMPAEGHGVPE